MNAILIHGHNLFELTLELVLAPGDLGAQILQVSDVWVDVHHKLPEFDVVFGATLNIVLEFDHSIGVLKIFVDLCSLSNLHLHHFSLYYLQIVILVKFIDTAGVL
jgi:hypothetical protein